jgi:hypothetical protein
VSGPKRYIPILRWKRAERRALRYLRRREREMITPILELTPAAFEAGPSNGPPRRTPLPSDVLLRMATGIAECWGRQAAFVDLSLFTDRLRPRKSFWEAMASHLLSTDATVIPVVPLWRAESYDIAVLREFGAEEGRGACLRLKEVDLLLEDLPRRVEKQLSALRLAPALVDLVIDFEGNTQDSLGYGELCRILPHIMEWRSFTVVSGHFPENLATYTRNVDHRLTRRDLLRWREETAIERQLSRIPAYGDYTVQFPYYRAPVRAPNPSVSVRYALEGEWLILRGEQVKGLTSPGRAQWIGWSQWLSDAEEFYGRTFSAGDAYIFQRTLPNATTGDFSDWIFVAINHHLTLTARQISKRFGSSSTRRRGGADRRDPSRYPPGVRR